MEANLLSKDNNFNLIRLIAATFVLFNHCFVLTGDQFKEPLWNKFGTFVTFGPLGVDIFFTISGFLLCNSIMNNGNVLVFAVNRFFRIFPGLVFSNIVVVILVGCFFTELHFWEFIRNSETINYFVFNSILVIKRISFSLPEAFLSNPIHVINGSLWTLPQEIKAYSVLVLAYILLYAVLPKKFDSFRLGMPLFSIFYYLNFSDAIYSHSADLGDDRMFFFFFAGATCSVYIRYIKLNVKAAIVLVFINGISIYHPNVFFPVYTLSLPYVVLSLAYSQNRFLRRYNEVGDYSYGLYIYAFPVQQFIVGTFNGIGPYSLFFSAFCVALMFAIVSWHLVESNAIGFKANAIKLAKTRRFQV